MARLEAVDHKGRHRQGQAPGIPLRALRRQSSPLGGGNVEIRMACEQPEELRPEIAGGTDDSALHSHDYTGIRILMQRRGRDGNSATRAPRHRAARRRATGGRGPIPPRRRRQLSDLHRLGRCGDPDPDRTGQSVTCLQRRAVSAAVTASSARSPVTPIMPIAYKKPLVCGPDHPKPRLGCRAGPRGEPSPHCLTGKHRPSRRVRRRQVGTMAPATPASASWRAIR